MANLGWFGATQNGKFSSQRERFEELRRGTVRPARTPLVLALGSCEPAVRPARTPPVLHKTEAWCGGHLCDAMRLLWVLGTRYLEGNWKVTGCVALVQRKVIGRYLEGNWKVTGCVALVERTR